VATLCNNRPIDSTDLSHRVADIYLHGKLSAALAAEAGRADSFHLDRKQLATNAGTYVDKSENLALKIEQRGDSLWGESFTGPSAIGPAQLEALSESRFRGVGMKEIDFGADPNHRELTVKRVGMPDIRFRHVADYKPTAAQLREFTGTYSSKELDVPYYVTFAKDSIVLHPPKMPGEPLQALTNDLFICDGMRVRFARDPKQHVSGFLMSGRWNRVQNLRFERVGQP
jgi:hypothetical protein